MRRDQFTVTDVTGSQGTKKLEDYNRWLLDPCRAVGEGVYREDQGKKRVGFTKKSQKTEEKPRVSRGKDTKKTVDFSVEMSHNTRTVTNTHKGTEMKETKLSRAIAIVKQAASKQEALAEIQNCLGVTKSNAFVYYTKATKTSDGVSETVEKAAVSATKARKVNPITETSVGTVTKKVKEIDAVIAGLRAKGVAASPFAGL